MIKNIVPTGRLNVIGVHRKPCALIPQTLYQSGQRSYHKCDNDTEQLLVFALIKLHNANEVNDFDFITVYSYLTTNLIHRTLAERITITNDDGIVSYISKQNVHHKIIKIIINKIMQYIKNDPEGHLDIQFPDTRRMLLKEITRKYGN